MRLLPSNLMSVAQETPSLPCLVKSNAHAADGAFGVKPWIDLNPSRKLDRVNSPLTREMASMSNSPSLRPINVKAGREPRAYSGGRRRYSSTYHWIFGAPTGAADAVNVWKFASAAGSTRSTTGSAAAMARVGALKSVLRVWRR